jgi:transcriptional regulator GlxA family with amidase domain
MLRVTFFICDQMLATSVTLPLEQLTAAQSLAVAAQDTRVDTPEMEVVLASVDGQAISTNTGIRLQPHCALQEIEHSDITYIPALWRNPRPQLRRNQAALSWLQRQNTLGNIIAGVGTGCCFMAEAGLLDNKAATTHWHYFEQFQKHYPKVHLKRQYFITQAGNLYCTGSVNSLADLTIHFIQRYFSGHIAHHVERHFFHEIRKTYPNSESAQGLTDAHPDEDIIRAQVWLQENFAQEVRLAQVAGLFDMSVRSFNRRFKAATGQTPLQYLHNARIQVAKELLQTSNLSIGEIAYRAGYQDFAHFTRLFKRLLGVTPSQYRTTVRAKMFSL